MPPKVSPDPPNAGLSYLDDLPPDANFMDAVVARRLADNAVIDAREAGNASPPSS